MLLFDCMSVSKFQSFTPYHLAFGCEMRLPVDFFTPLPELPRYVQSVAAELAKNVDYT